MRIKIASLTNNLYVPLIIISANHHKIKQVFADFVVADRDRWLVRLFSIVNCVIIHNGFSSVAYLDDYVNVKHFGKICGNLFCILGLVVTWGVAIYIIYGVGKGRDTTCCGKVWRFCEIRNFSERKMEFWCIMGIAIVRKM